LDAESKCLRFGYPVTDYVIDQLCDKFEAETDKHVLFAIENRKLEFIGVGHIALAGEMELAFSVLKKHQGRGFGSLLMKRCIQYCRTHSLLKGHMVCLVTNSAIKHLCAKHGIQTHSEHGETLADIELDHPSMNTYLAEATSSNLAVLDYLGKRIPKFNNF
jgi:GNAT superfamily N-acetyltransferase